MITSTPCHLSFNVKHTFIQNGFDGAKRRKIQKTEKKVGKVKVKTVLKEDGGVEKVSNCYLLIYYISI